MSDLLDALISRPELLALLGPFVVLVPILVKVQRVYAASMLRLNVARAYQPMSTRGPALTRRDKLERVLAATIAVARAAKGGGARVCDRCATGRGATMLLPTISGRIQSLELCSPCTITGTPQKGGPLP